MSEQLVLFGGAFDPVHNGHLIVARALAERRGFERVTLVPTGRPPHKPAPVASGAHRLRMLQLAVEAEGLFDICDLELRRQGPSYTIDTLTELRRLRGADAELTWVIGADMVQELPAWHRVGELLEMATILIAARPPWDRQMPGVIEALAGPLGAAQARSLAGCVVDTPRVDISSSQVRQRAAEGKSVRFLVPDAVGAYLAEFGLYGEGAKKPPKNAQRT
ncbi:MAG TPA: nicotinate-nucleotide adenylyltransferase [Phycisphaerae bacterium]|nr:nicotinate-nucleotide adenylyltransferase [Phycisphaerae bacterium]